MNLDSLSTRGSIRDESETWITQELPTRISLSFPAHRTTGRCRSDRILREAAVEARDPHSISAGEAALCCRAKERYGRLEADLVVDEERDVELDEDHGDDLEVDEEEISACAPYLARQMSCLGRVTPGVKDTPF